MNDGNKVLSDQTKTSFGEAANSIGLGASSDVITVCWYRQIIGTMSATEEGLRWNGFDTPEMEKFFGEILPTREEDSMPQFLVNLLPDNTVFEKLGINDQEEYLKSGLRFPSNTIVSTNAPFDLTFNNDYLTAHLEDFTDETGVFTGAYQGKPPKSLEENALAEELSSIWKNRYVPRYSGKEMKIPVTLQEQGELQKAISTPFTHFLKLPNEGLKEGWGFNEWMCMQLCKATGLPTAKHALIQIDENMPPAYLVERFDINHESRRGVVRRILQDFCTLAGMRPLNDLQATNKEGMAAGTIEQISKTIRQFSTDPQKDVENLFQRSLVSIAVGDSDMHRKNISMLFRYDVGKGKEISANMSPAYDITSEIYEEEAKLTTVLAMGGKRNKFSRKSLVSTAKNMGLTEERANEIIDNTFTTIAERAVEIARNMPDIAKDNYACKYTAGRIATIAVNRAQTMGCPTPEWEPVERIKLKTNVIEGTVKAVSQPALQF